MDKYEDKVRITGIGLSQIGRRLYRDPIGMAVEASLNAMADAGLDRDDIDGLCTHPGAQTSNGYSGAGIGQLENVLRVNPKWFNSGHEMPGHGGALVSAALAVAAGVCNHVLVFRSTWESTAADMARNRPDPPSTGSAAVEGDRQWLVPFGAFSAAQWIAQYACEHFRKYGTSREQLGAIALNARHNAGMNSDAVYREPLTMDDYLGARVITTPFGLYDCDVPCDGAVAVIVSSTTAAKDTRKSPIHIEALGTQQTEPWSWDQGTKEHEVLLKGPCDHLWARTDLKPKDVDVAELYDGFTFNCLSWIELMGFCAIGEGGPFVEGGSRIALDGELPLNTHGGQLSAGRLNGFGFIHEACAQLWGECGERQVPNQPAVAAVTTGGGAPGGAMLLVRD